MAGSLKLPVALTIAGSDSGGGAGIQADLKTFAMLGVHGTSAITAVTAQNTLGVSEILELPTSLIREQIAVVVEDIGVQAAKTGMLSSAAIIATVAEAVTRYEIAKLVVDPVMVAKGGARLLRDDAVSALRERLIPLAAVVTPNLPEAQVLLGREIRTLEERRAAARELVAMGARVAVVKGGHADDVIAVEDPGLRQKVRAGSRPRTRTAAAAFSRRRSLPGWPVAPNPSRPSARPRRSSRSRSRIRSRSGADTGRLTRRSMSVMAVKLFVP